METYITTPAGRDSTRLVVEDKLLHDAYEYLLVIFHGECATKNNVLFKFELFLHAVEVPDEAKEIYRYIIVHFDELMRYLVSKSLIKIVNKWSKESHFRFSRNERLIIETLLLVQKRTNFTVKDVLIKHIIPDVVKQLHIPTFYISNLSLETTEEMLRSKFNVPLSNCRISMRRNGRSKGFGFLTCLKWNDYAEFLPKNNGIIIDGRKVVIELSKY